MTGHLVFTVKDNSTKNPISGAKCDIGTKSGSTNSKGVCDISVTTYKSYSYIVSKSGYDNKTGSLSVKDGETSNKNVYLSPKSNPTPTPPTPPQPPSPPPPSPNREAYQIVSVPSHASVLIDGRNAGTTPVSGTERPGNYAIMMQLAGYNDESFTMRITEGTSFYKSVTLTPIAPPPPPPGPIKEAWMIESVPSGARVLFEGNYAGVTPLNGTSIVKSYAVRLTLEGYNDYDFTMNITEGTSFYRKITMVPIAPLPPVYDADTLAIIALEPTLTTGEKDKVAALSTSDKAFYLAYLREPIWTKWQDTPRVNNIYFRIHDRDYYDFDTGKNDFVRWAGDTLADLSPTVATMMMEIDPQWWTNYAQSRSQEAGMSRADWEANFNDNLAMNIGIEGALAAFTGPIMQVLQPVLGPISGILKGLFDAAGRVMITAFGKAGGGFVTMMEKLIPQWLLRSSLVSNTRGSIGPLLSYIKSAIKSGLDNLVSVIRGAPKAQTTQAKINAWMEFREKGLAALEKQASYLSKESYDTAKEIIESKYAKGVDTLLRGLGSDIVGGSIPWSEVVRGAPGRVASWLSNHKAWIITTVPMTAIAVYGLLNFADFISEEAIQSIAFAASIALNTLDNSSVEMWEANKKVARDTLDAQTDMLNLLQRSGKIFREGRPISGEPFIAFFNAEKMKLAAYEAKYASLVERGPRGGPSPTGETAHITASPIPINVALDNAASETHWSSPFDISIQPGYHTLTFSKEPDYEQQTINLTIRAGASPYVAPITLVRRGVPPPTPPPETTAKIVIQGTPAGADVDLDGTYTYKQAPTTLNVAAGYHSITIRKRDYYEDSADVNPIDGETIRLDYTLTQITEEPPPYEPPYVPPYTPPYTPPVTPGEPGTIDIYTMPANVDVEIPGFPAGNTGDYGNVSIDVPAGTYEVRLSKPGYLSETQNVFLKAGQHYVMRVFLVEGYEPGPGPTPGPGPAPTAWRYDITSTPSGAKIIVNDEFQDKWTPDYVILEPSAYYILRVEKSGYYPAEIEIYTDPID